MLQLESIVKQPKFSLYQATKLTSEQFHRWWTRFVLQQPMKIFGRDCLTKIFLMFSRQLKSLFCPLSTCRIIFSFSWNSYDKVGPSMFTCKYGSANNIFSKFLSRNVTWYFAYSVHLLLLPVQGGSPVGQQSELSSLCLLLRLVGQRIGSLLHIHSGIGLATPFYTCNLKLRVYFAVQWPQKHPYTISTLLLLKSSSIAWAISPNPPNEE